MSINIAKILKNYKGGLIGLLIAVIISTIFYFTAFMIAFGNPAPASKKILQIINILFILMNPLWFYPIAYIIGAYFIKPKNK